MASLSTNMADHDEMVRKIELSVELKFAKRVAVLVERLEKHYKSRNEQFEILDTIITGVAFDAEEDTLGEGGPITTILNAAHCINDADNKFIEQTIVNLKNELPGEAHIHKIQSELSAISERDKAIDNLFEESEDEESTKDEEIIKEEKKEETIK
ncbi:hypothetical protein KCU95_g7923, partial [Aureobasidium melanogenum]